MGYSNPVGTPDGNTIYFLCAPADSVDWPNFSVGAIYSITTNGGAPQKVMDGKFHSLAVSPDGKKLAMHSYKSYYNFEPESLILVYNLTNSAIDSYPIPQMSPMSAEQSSLVFIYQTLLRNIFKLSISM